MTEGAHNWEDIYAEQAAECGNAMSLFELKSIWNGFPPGACILNPQSLSEAVAQNDEVCTPLKVAAEKLEEMCGPQTTLANKSQFNKSANPDIDEGIASLSYDNTPRVG
ncbi:MAG: hypothetical protein KTR28_04990 [Micavibrio sp.]|nr:hypothetical protein [Micavibrio sp.]